MDLFVLDKLVLNYFKSLTSNAYTQLATLIGLWSVLGIVLPTKKVKK